MMNDADEQLVQQTLNGDSNGFNRLMEKYQSTVFGIAYHWTKNAADAQDLMQEAFLKAYERLHTLRDANRFASWLQQITVNLCRMWQRDGARRMLSIDEPAGKAWLHTRRHPANQPQEAIEAQERQRAISDVLTLLPEKLRVTAELFYINDLTYREISELLSVPITTVEGRLHKARQKLREEATHTLAAAFGEYPGEH